MRVVEIAPGISLVLDDDVHLMAHTEAHLPKAPGQHLYQCEVSFRFSSLRFGALHAEAHLQFLHESSDEKPKRG